MMSCLEHVLGELDPLFEELTTSPGTARWVDVLRESARHILAGKKNGHFEKWLAARKQLPDLAQQSTELDGSVVRIDGDCNVQQRTALRNALMGFHPWRKGPFELFGVNIDAEWRSDLKWARIQPHIDLTNKNVLDVGCGNGYYGWRMLGHGARRVVGIEPYPLYLLQHNAIQKYLPTRANYVAAGTDSVLSNNGSRLEAFDVAFSMGVLYHAKDPIGHLEKMRSSLRPGGLFVLETLVVDGDEDTIFVPPGRYAKMRNVWILPSPLALEKLLTRVGFSSIEMLHIATTKGVEQRQTAWMTFESLADFLTPDGRQTIEGHPAPKRAVFLAR